MNASPMQFYLDKIKRLKVGWNERPLSEEDFYRLCSRHSITIVEMPLETNGFYYCVKGRHYIAISSSVERFRKLLVMFHEFAHFLMHVPDSSTTANFHGVGRRTRKEREADAFALCAIIPKTWIESRTVDELVDEGIPEDMLRERLDVYERWKI
jgi:Zn-dependent peptidase ImmA (M78 family)